MQKRYDRFEQIRKEHTLTDDEIDLITKIAVGKDESLDECFNHILSETLSLRSLTNDIDTPQKASEAKKHVSNENKIAKLTARLKRSEDQWEKQEEIIAKAEAKKEELETLVESLSDEVEIIQGQQKLLGPERLNEISSKYLDDLSTLMDIVLQVSEVLGDEDIESELPYLSPYLQEYMENGEIDES